MKFDIKIFFKSYLNFSLTH